jgi:hypothetical protein
MPCFFQLSESSAENSRIDLRVRTEKTAETIDPSQPDIGKNEKGPFASENAQVRLDGTSRETFSFHVWKTSPSQWYQYYPSEPLSRL